MTSPRRHRGAGPRPSLARALALAAAIAGTTPTPASAPAAGPFSPDAHTLLLAHFDRGADADHSAGPSLAEGEGEPVAQGRFGAAIALGPRQSIGFAGKDNFPGAQGTIEFWMQPRWNGDDGQARLILDARTGRARNQIAVNKLANGRLGAGMFGTPNGSTEFVYRRADADVSSWKASSWHHVAVCWTQDRLTLWLDGKIAAEKTGALAPQDIPDTIRLTGSDYAIDELCISAVARYSDQGRLTGKPVPTRVQRGHGWKFNEPAGVYSCTPPAGLAAEAGVAFLPKDYLDDVDPTRLPAHTAPSVELAAAPGETEPATFLVVATRPLRQVKIRVSDLRSDRGTLDARRIVVRRVVRTPMRRIYTAPAHETEIVNRFLPRWQPTDILAGEFREAWLSFALPDDLPAGRYAGEINVAHAEGQRTVPVHLDAYPFQLVEHPRKALASYYRVTARLADRARLLRELRDMREHGIRHLCAHLGIRYAQGADGKIAPDLSAIRDGLALLRQAGFGGGTIILESGLAALARMLGHSDLGKGEPGTSLDRDARFRQLAKQAMDRFVELKRQTPDFRLFLSHLDEVFGSRPLLEQYIRLSKAARQVPDAGLYITFHTRDERSDAWRAELDPYVDLRCNHGYTFELWLARGHSMDQYDAELARSGDEAWFYHNARGIYWTAEWARIINGIYLWAGPFTAHCPWTYQAWYENPFDDTDGPAAKGHDWGLSFPGPDDPNDLVPTRAYEAMREGGDDLRYFATLERAIAHTRPTNPADATAAQRVLDRWRTLVRTARPAPHWGGPAAARPEPAGPGPDRKRPAAGGTGIPRGILGTGDEAPIVSALANRFNAVNWREMRREIANWIVRLH